MNFDLLLLLQKGFKLNLHKKKKKVIHKFWDANQIEEKREKGQNNIIPTFIIIILTMHLQARNKSNSTRVVIMVTM